jgi:hypothetical protein
MANTTTKDPITAEAPATSGNGHALALPAQPSPLLLGSDAFRVGLEPSTLNDAYRLAEMIATTRICGVESPEDALVRMMTGRSLGLSTMQSLRGVYVVKGRPSLDASLMQALCMKSPVCEYFECVSTDETQATYKTKRKGRPERVLQFTIEDAQRQGLVERGKDDDAKAANNYVKIPKEMLRARCKSSLARLEYPDLMFGMYSREELEAGVDDGESGDFADVQKRMREQEIEVEIVQTPVRAAPRDYEKEALTLIDRIHAARSRQAREEVRLAIEAWDGVEPHLSRVKEAYNATRRNAQAAPDAPKGPTGATGSGPAPMPTGNLFAGTSEESKK